jgi:hypothetical protein
MAGDPDLDIVTRGDKVLVTCRVCGPERQDDVIAALQERDLWPRSESNVVRLNVGRTERSLRGPAAKLVSTTIDELPDMDGVRKYRHVRNDYDDGSKECLWERFDGSTWRTGLGGVKPSSLPLFGMERLKDLPDGATVVLHEGEKAKKAGDQLGLISLGTVTGAKVIPSDDVLRELVRFNVVRWDDHDDDGHKHMHRISGRLVALGGSSRILTWPDARPKDDAADFLERGGTPEQAGAMVVAAAPFNPIGHLNIINAVDLAAMQFAEPKTIVRNLLVEGATLLVAPGKSGKSRLMMNVAVGVAHGGKVLGSIDVLGGDVLYLALEDGKRRGQSRMLAACGGDVPARLDLAFEWPTMDNGGIEALELWLIAHPNARMIAVDTFKRFRASRSGRRNAYDDDYDALAPLNDLALKYGVCIVIIHHTNKIKISDDPTDRASGSTGMLAAVDGMIVMERTRGQADSVLHVFHRDLEDAQYAIKADADLGWRWLGDAAEYARTELQDEIVSVILDAGRSLKPGDVAIALDKDRKVIGQRMWQMTKPNANGLQVLVSQGGYYWPASRPWPGGSDDDEESENSRNRHNRDNRSNPDNQRNQQIRFSGKAPDQPEMQQSLPVTTPDESCNRVTGEPPGETAAPVTPVTPVWRCPVCRALEREVRPDGSWRCKGGGHESTALAEVTR